MANKIKESRSRCKKIVRYFIICRLHQGLFSHPVSDLLTNQSFQATFESFIQNTGHRVCGWKKQSYNLAHIIQCSDEDNRDDSIRPHDAAKQYIDRYCPGWPKTPDPSMDSCPIVKPMTGDMHHQIYWWKPEGGVYRSAMFPWRYPIQGL